MSVLIKMEMPKTCEECDFCQWSNFHQTAVCDRCDYEPVCVDYGTDYRRGRASFCPLVEVPTPHGRLIDADALNTYDVSPIYEFCVMGVTEEDIGLALTIIEAEGSEE